MNKNLKGLSTPVAILIAGVLISGVVLYSNGDLPFITADDDNATVQSAETVDADTPEARADKYAALAKEIGLDDGKLKECTLKMDKAEIEQDIADASALGASGTPAFFVGKDNKDGTAKTIAIFGAYPIETFSSLIDAFKANDEAAILAAVNDMAVLGNPEAEPITDLSTVYQTVPLGDDAVKGNKDTDIVLVEFSDYECPFCQRHFQQTYPTLNTKYIETGQVKMIFRDLPLDFHDPVATEAAVAANCAREQGGDEAYYKFHDAYFTNTKSNGEGL